MKPEERIDRLEAGFRPQSVHIVYWEKYKGITKQQAIDEYCLKNNITDIYTGVLPPIIVCIPSDDEIREWIDENKEKQLWNRS